MVPRKKRSVAKRPKLRAVSRVRKSRPQVPRYMLDKAALEWAALLRDPCNAKLTYPCYPSGSGAAILMRVEADSIIASGATETAAFGAYIPGLGLHLANSTPQTTDTLGSLMAGNQFIQPANSFITSNAASLRAVAACVQISFPGTELNRSGVVGMGVVPAGIYINNLPTAAGGGNINGNAQIHRVQCQHVERMPQNVVECKWFPGENDALAQTATTYPVAFAQLLNGRNAIGWSASGFPAGTGIRVRTVVVYEVTLLTTSATGTVQAVAPPVSVNTPAHVVKAMIDRDPQWYIESANKAGRAVGSVINYAAQGVKAAGAFVNGMALVMA